MLLRRGVMVKNINGGHFILGVIKSGFTRQDGYKRFLIQIEAPPRSTS